MGHRHEGRGKPQQWVVVIVILVTMLCVSAIPGHARDGGGRGSVGRGFHSGHGGGGHGFHGGHGWKGHGFHGGHSGGAMASMVDTVGKAMASHRRTQLGRRKGHHRGRPYWGPYGYLLYPYAYPYAYPYTYPPQIYIQPPRSHQSSRPHHHLSGTTVTIQRATTPMSNSVPVAGERWPRTHNRWSETVFSRLSKWAVQAHFQNTAFPGQ